MKYINRTINEIGLAEIHSFLAENHRLGGDHIDRDMLLSWAADAEFQLAEGNSATIEIKSWASIHGRTQEFTISDAGFDSEIIEIDE